MKCSQALIKSFKQLTGITARRVRALRQVGDWADEVKKFVESYDISENVQVENILGKSGDIKFELTVLSYKGRMLSGQAGCLKNKQTEKIIIDTVDILEKIRRYLFSPALQKERMRKALIDLAESSVALQKALAEIEIE